MNMAEGLARELVRVAELRERYRELDGKPQINVKPALGLLDAALEQGCKAAGSNDAVKVIQAYTNLQGFEK